MPHKDPVAKRAYANALYAKKAHDPAFRKKWNGDRDRHEGTCQVCSEPFHGRRHKKTCGPKCASILCERNKPRRPPNPTPWLADPDSRGKGSLNAQGYRMVYRPDHPNANAGKHTIQEHRVVMEQMLGRLMEPWETVHHRNGMRSDNRKENLELWTRPHPPGVRASEVAHCATCTCAAHAE